MKLASYYLGFAYVFLIVSALTLLIAALIFGLACIDVLFGVGFGYPVWSVPIIGLVAFVGYLMVRLSLGFLRRTKQQSI
jgi:hypothetical protein